MAATHPSIRRSRLGLALWIVALTAGLWAFHGLGAGWLEPPPSGPDGWWAWAQSRDPLVATVAILRLVVLALGWYLLAVTLLGVLARVARAPRAIRAADLVTVPALRRFLRASLGVSLASALLASGPSMVGFGEVARASPRVVVEVGPGLGDLRVDGVAGEASDLSDGATLPGTSIPLPLELVTGDRPSAPPTDGAIEPDVVPGRAMPGSDAARPGPAPSSDDARRPTDAAELPTDARPLPGTGPGTGAGPPAEDPAAGHVDATETARTAASAATPAAPGLSVGVGEEAVVVQPGDSLWSIADDALREAAGEAVPEERVAAYWLRVVERNRAHLPDSANPDLIFPGDTIVLPPVDGTAGDG